MKYQLILGSCESVPEIKDDSIGCIFTSPPYALAKNYGDNIEGDIGNCQDVESYKEYLKMMFNVFKECFRVLKPGRYIGVNIADVIQSDKYGSERKPIRFNYHTILSKAGFKYCEHICWKKPDGLTTQKRFGVLIQNPYPLYYHPNNIYEPILVYKKLGKANLTDDNKKNNQLDMNWAKKYQTDIWEIPPETNVKHPAPFPVELPYAFFKLNCLKGETIFEPFTGSGSSLIAARKAKMNAIGCEINPDYIQLIKQRFEGKDEDQLTLVETDEVELIKR